YLALPCTLTLRLSVHDALPISADIPLQLRRYDGDEPAGLEGRRLAAQVGVDLAEVAVAGRLQDERGVDLEQMGHVLSGAHRPGQDRKSTRLNSSHGSISYAVFC